MNTVDQVAENRIGRRVHQLVDHLATSGYERGREKKFVEYNMGMEITKDARVSRADVSAEAYLRVGLAFGQ